MAIFAQDSFTDTDSTVLTSHTGETGASWAKVSGYSGDAVINSNKLDNTTTDSAHYASGDPASADYDVEADYNWINSALCTFQILGRVSTSEATFYTGYYRRGSNTYRIEKCVSGSFTTLATASGDSPSEGVAVNIRLNLSGTDLELFGDDVSKLTASDASISAAGKAGLAFTSTGTSAPRVQVDNFLAEDGSGGGSFQAAWAMASNVLLGAAPL